MQVFVSSIESEKEKFKTTIDIGPQLANNYDMQYEELIERFYRIIKCMIKKK